MAELSKQDRDELRRECQRKISDGKWTYETGNILNLLDALDEADKRIAELERTNRFLLKKTTNKMAEAKP